MPEPRRVKITGDHLRNPRRQPARRNRPPTLPPAGTVAASTATCVPSPVAVRMAVLPSGVCAARLASTLSIARRSSS